MWIAGRAVGGGGNESVDGLSERSMRRMNHKILHTLRVRQLLEAAKETRIFVLGDVMLDQFVWGRVGRISPEAPVPIVEFERESFIPGGAANVARNLADLNVSTELFGMVGHDEAAAK